MKKHIVIAGERHVGKTSLVRKLIDGCSVPIYGFETRTTDYGPDGYHGIYMYAAGSTDDKHTRENHVGDCNRKDRRINLDVFDRLGVRLLEAKPDGIIVMDELGFMEEGSKYFCDRVLELLDGDIPVIATAKCDHFGGFLDKVRNHGNVLLYTLTEENRDEVYAELRPIVEELIM